MKKNIIKIKILTIFTLILFCIMSVHAEEPFQTGQTGTWDIVTYPDFYEDGSERIDVTGFANYSIITEPISINTTGGYGLNLTINELIGDRIEWYWFEGSKKFYVALELYNNLTDEHVYGLMQFVHTQAITYKSNYMKVGTIQKNILIPRLLPEESLNFEGGLFGVEIINVDNTTAMINYYATPNTPEAYLPYTGDNLIVNNIENTTVSSGFFDNLIVNLYLGHSGTGSFGIEFGYAFYRANTFEQTETELIDENSNWIQIIIDFFGTVYNVLTQLWDLAITAFLAIIPYAPYILLFYILDAFVTSIFTTSFKPIGYCFTQLYEWFMILWNGAINLLSAIGEIIPF